MVAGWNFRAVVGFCCTSPLCPAASAAVISARSPTNSPTSGPIDPRVERETAIPGHPLRPVARILDRRSRRQENRIHGKTATHVLADLELELRLFRYPVRLGIADGEHERHLRIPGRAGRSDPDSVAGRAADWIAGAADRRPGQRPHLGFPGPARFSVRWR